MPAFAPLLVALLFTSASPALKFDAPAGWVSKPPSSSSRVAEFALPKAEGDGEDASLVVYFFGANMGGNVQANVDRWIGQMAQPDGKSSADVTKKSTLTANGLKVTLVDISGTYVAEVSPGSTEHFNKPGFRLRAAVIETSEGPYFIKLTGPAKTVARWDESFMTFLKSVRVGTEHQATWRPGLQTRRARLEAGSSDPAGAR
jgi:hypothetical protein